MSKSRKALARDKKAYERTYRNRGYKLGSPAKTWSKSAAKPPPGNNIVNMFSALHTQQRMRESFDASIRESWPGPLILSARKAIADQDHQALDKVISTLEHYP